MILLSGLNPKGKAESVLYFFNTSLIAHSVIFYNFVLLVLLFIKNWFMVRNRWTQYPAVFLSFRMYPIVFSLTERFLLKFFFQEVFHGVPWGMEVCRACGNKLKRKGWR